MEDNWYLILDLEFDPEVKDPEVIKKRIMEKLSYWNKNKTGPSDEARKYGLLVTKYKQIESDMLNEVTRTKCAEDARKIVSSTIDPAIKMVSGDGLITDDQIKSIAKTNKVSEDIVKKRVVYLGVKVTASPKAIYDKYFGSEPEDKSKYDTIIAKELVAFDKVDSLYGFLYSDLISTTAKESAYSRSDILIKVTEREDDFKKMHASEPKKGAGEKLIMSCVDIFKDDESRKKYDNYLMYIRLEKIISEINMFQGGSKISQEYTEKFVERIFSVINNKDEAERFFTYYCRQNDIEYVKQEKTQPTPPTKDPKTELFDAIRLSGMSGFLSMRQAEGFIVRLMPLYGGSKSTAKREFDAFCNANGIEIESISPTIPTTSADSLLNKFMAWFMYLSTPAKAVTVGVALVVAVVGYGGLFGGWFNNKNEDYPVYNPSENAAAQIPTLASDEPSETPIQQNYSEDIAPVVEVTQPPMQEQSIQVDNPQQTVAETPSTEIPVTESTTAEPSDIETITTEIPTVDASSVPLQEAQVTPAQMITANPNLQVVASGNITNNEQIDIHHYTAPQSGIYQFVFSSSSPLEEYGLDYSFFIFDVNDKEVKSARAYTGGFTVTLNANQEYTFQVRQRREYLDYTISVITPSVLAVSGNEINGNIQYREQIDIYSYTAPQNGIYQFVFSSSSPLEEYGLDYSFFIFDANDKEVKSARAYTGGFTVTLNANQEYTFQVRQRRDYMDYTVSIITPGISVVNGNEIKGNIQYREQVDIHSYTAPQNGIYQFVFSSSSPLEEYGLDYSFFIFDANDKEVKSARAYTGGFTVTLNANQEYTFQVRQRRDYMDYTISIITPSVSTINGNEIKGNIQYREQIDIHSYTAPQNGIYQFVFSSSSKLEEYGLDYSFFIFDPTGKEVKSARAYTGGFTVTLNANQEYTFQVRQRRDYMDYTISIITPNISVVNGNEIRGDIQYNEQIDIYSYTAPQSGIYQFVFSSSSTLEEYGLDYSFFIFDATGEEVKSARAYTGGFTVTLNANQEYTFHVRQRRDYMDYIINIITPTILAVSGNEIRGNIQYNEQIDIYSYTAPQSGIYQFVLSSSSTLEEYGLDYSFYIFDATGEEIESARAYTGGFTVTLNAGQEYIFHVRQRRDYIDYIINLSFSG